MDLETLMIICGWFCGCILVGMYSSYKQGFHDGYMAAKNEGEK